MSAHKRDLLWQVEVEKIGGKALVEIIAEMRDGQSKILKQLDAMDKRHTTSEIRIDKLFTGFPQGDVEGHGRYHDALIKATEARREMWKNIAEKTIAGLIWLAVLYIGSVFWRETANVVTSMVTAKQVP